MVQFENNSGHAIRLPNGNVEIVEEIRTKNQEHVRTATVDKANFDKLIEFLQEKP